MKQRKNTLFYAIFGLFFLIFSSISFVNHYLFRTSAFDLGLMNQALYDFSHFRVHHISMDFSSRNMNFFGDHFSPIVFLFVPFYYIFGSYTLLIIQILSILFGGYGIYKYAIFKGISNKTSLVILFQFFGIWGIYSALSFDFHTNVVAAMLIPWLVLFYEKRNYKLFLIFYLLILFSKENMALWAGFILIGLFLKNRNYKSLRFSLINICLTVFALIYFVVIVKLIMPLMDPSEQLSQMNRYTHLGDSLSEIIFNLLKNPSQIFKQLFENTSGEPFFDGIKLEFHWMVLVSGGFLFLVRPYYIIMLIPIYAQKFLSSDIGFWGINSQYSIELVPLLSLALVDSVKLFKGKKIGLSLVIIVALSTHFFNIDKIDHRTSKWYSPENTKYYGPEHYKNDNLNISETYKALKLIPDKIPISVNSPLAPHLARRTKMYFFPIINDAEYIAVATYSTYPMSKEQQQEKIDNLKSGKIFNVIYEKNNILIMQKKK